MSRKTYVVRANFFAYNDEWYSIYGADRESGGAIKCVTTSLPKAERELVKLSAEAFAKWSFGAFGENYTDEHDREVKRVIEKITGRTLVPRQDDEDDDFDDNDEDDYIQQEFVDNEWYYSSTPFSELFSAVGKEAGLAVLAAAGLTSHTICVFDEPDVFVIKDALTGRYLEDGWGHDDGGGGPCPLFFLTEDALVERVAQRYRMEEWVIEGTLDELVISPVLLNAIATTESSIVVDTKKITVSDSEGLRRLLPLLKSPPFHYERMHLRDVMNMTCHPDGGFMKPERSI